MKIWNTGLAPQPFEAVKAGKKTIEARLYRGKFAHICAGDKLAIRADYYNDAGELCDGEPDALHAVVVAIRRYATFRELLESEGVKRVIPWEETIDAACAVYDLSYAPNDQQAHGVVAFELDLK